MEAVDYFLGFLFIVKNQSLVSIGLTSSFFSVLKLPASKSLHRESLPSAPCHMGFFQTVKSSTSSRLYTAVQFELFYNILHNTTLEWLLCHSHNLILKGRGLCRTVHQSIRTLCHLYIVLQSQSSNICKYKETSLEIVWKRFSFGLNFVTYIH